MIDDFNLLLLSGGVFECSPEWDKAASGIDQCFKVYIPVEGEARLIMESGDVTLRPESVYFISGFKLQRQLCPRRMKIYWLHFVPESLYLRHLLDELPEVCRLSRTEAGWPEACDGDLESLFENARAAKNRYRADTSPVLACRIQSLLLGLIARLLARLEEHQLLALPPEYCRLKAALDFMQVHFRRNPSLEEIAARAALAPNYFHRRFRRLFQATPFDFMLLQRLNQARHLLVATELSVKEVAAAVGYEDASYFTRVFTQRLAISPSRYRLAQKAQTPPRSVELGTPADVADPDGANPP